MIDFNSIAIDDILNATKQRFLEVHYDKESDTPKDTQWQNYLSRLRLIGKISSQQYFRCYRLHFF